MALRPWLNDVEKLFRELVFLFCILACKRLYYIAPSYMRWCWRWSQKRPHNLLAGYKQCFLEIEPCDANIKNQERLWSHHKHDDLMTCWPTANAVNIQRSCTADDIGSIHGVCHCFWTFAEDCCCLDYTRAEAQITDRDDIAVLHFDLCQKRWMGNRVRWNPPAKVVHKFRPQAAVCKSRNYRSQSELQVDQQWFPVLLITVV